MIISHKYKFIFLKPRKVAGTSLEIALAKHCGDEDIITPITNYSEFSDSAFYNQPIKNYEEGYYNHMPPSEIKEKIGKDIWNKYFKFTVIRNPWDQQVSLFTWRKTVRRQSEKFRKRPLSLYVKKILNPRSYFIFCKKILKRIIFKNGYFLNRIQNASQADNNTKFYFDTFENQVCDFYIRYENLEEDYHKVCNKLGIPYEKLPLTKDKHRDHDKHYSDYYDDNTEFIVAEKFKKEIEYFSFKFERILRNDSKLK